MIRFIMPHARREVIAKNFKRLRTARKWTQEECAMKGGVTQGYIAQVESGKNKSFGIEAEQKWAEIFGVDWLEFYRLENNHFAEVIRRAIGGLTEEERNIIEETVKAMAEGFKKHGGKKEGGV